MDSNLNYEERSDGLMRISPKPGFRLYWTKRQNFLTEAVTTRQGAKWFVGVEALLQMGEKELKN